MTALTTATNRDPTPIGLPVPVTTTFTLPPEWINKEMQVARNVEHLQAAIVDVSRNLMQIITWSEMIQEDIDRMKVSISTSISVSNLETSEEQPEPEEEQQDRRREGD